MTCACASSFPRSCAPRAAVSRRTPALPSLPVTLIMAKPDQSVLIIEPQNELKFQGTEPRHHSIINPTPLPPDDCHGVRSVAKWPRSVAGASPMRLSGRGRSARCAARAGPRYPTPSLARTRDVIACDTCSDSCSSYYVQRTYPN